VLTKFLSSKFNRNPFNSFRVNLCREEHLIGAVCAASGTKVPQSLITGYSPLLFTDVCGPLSSVPSNPEQRLSREIVSNSSSYPQGLPG
jgi:hypothetical protein